MTYSGHACEHIFLTMFLLIHSAIAVNLKACNHFRLYNGKAAEVRCVSCLSCIVQCTAVMVLKEAWDLPNTFNSVIPLCLFYSCRM